MGFLKEFFYFTKKFACKIEICRILAYHFYLTILYMPSLTFEPSKEQKKSAYPIAIVKGDDKRFHNKFLYVDPSENSKGIAEAEIPMGCIFNLLPSTDKDKRNIFYIAGASGSGKSWIAKQLAENYSKMYPDRPIYVVSKLTEDNTLDSMDLGSKDKTPIRLDYSLWTESPPDINSLSNSMIIFDDYDTIEGAEGKAVQSLIEDIAIMGRKHHDEQGNITMLCLTHYITNYKKTRLILNEADHFVVYPQATSTHALTYLLKTHLGLEKDDIKKLKKLGRWVCLHKSYPQYLISSQYAMLLHQD